MERVEYTLDFNERVGACPPQLGVGYRLAGTADRREGQPFR